MRNTDLKTMVQERIAGDDSSQSFELTVHRILAPEHNDHDFVEPVLGLVVELPNGGVYADWNIDAWPDDEQLQDPHVSIYGSLDDFEQVSEGRLDRLGTVDAYDP